MKKRIRSEKNKLIERAKTLIIALLFLLCLLLGYRILQLYKTQTNVDRALWGGVSGGAEVLENSDNLKLAVVCDSPEPQLMTLNSYSARGFINADSQIFRDISSLANQMLTEMYGAKSENLISATLEDWQRTLNGDSVYIKYPLVRYVDTDIAFCEMKSSNVQSEISEFREIIVAYDQSEEGTVTLYAADKNSDVFVKTKIMSDAAKEFKEKIKKLVVGDKKDLVFAWELNLDEKSEKNKTVLDSMLLLSAEDLETHTLSVTVPKLYKSGLNFTGTTDLTLALVNVFNYNPNTIRRYVNSDNSIMFVGETGSLNLHPEGVIEYKALDSDDGVALSSAEGLDGIFLGLGGMIEKILRISGINTANADFRLKMTSVPQTYRFDEKCEFELDYFVGDKKVELSDECSIRAVVQKGNLVELKMHLKDIKMQNREETMDRIFDAIDEFCEKNPEDRKIDDAYGVYVCREDGEDIKAEWRIEGAR